MLQARYHGFFTSDDAFIIYTFLLLWPSYQTRHSFLRLINQDLSSSRLCWYTKGTWHISFSPVKPNIQKTSILAQKLVLLLRGKNIHYNSVKLEALLRLETGNWFLFCLFWFLFFLFHTIIEKVKWTDNSILTYTAYLDLDLFRRPNIEPRVILIPCQRKGSRR